MSPVISARPKSDRHDARYLAALRATGRTFEDVTSAALAAERLDTPMPQRPLAVQAIGCSAVTAVMSRFAEGEVDARLSG
jgi:hypothetical protein